MGIIANKEKRLSDNIDKAIKDEGHKAFRTIRILLLGSGESGKSTILKQMRIFNNDGFTFEEREYFKIIIRHKVPNYILILLSAMKKCGIPFSDYSLQANANLLLAQLDDNNEFEYSHESVTFIQKLWYDPAMSKCYKMRNTLQLPDCAKYFLDCVDRIADTDYIFLQTRTSSTLDCQQVELSKRLSTQANSNFIFDVGGQKSERRKWLHCFDNVDSLIFITAISEYDQALEEDRTKNRMQDSLELYEAIINSDFFITKNGILFLNKIDLFKEKIANVPLNEAFPNYKGLQTYETGIFFIKNRFEKCDTRSKERKITVHETCATDTNQVKFVIEAVIRNIIIRKHQDCAKQL